MAGELRLRRGTTAQHGSFTGANGEVTFNTDTKELHTHDGVTSGGFPLVRKDALAATDSSVLVGGVKAGALGRRYNERVSVTDFSNLVVGDDWTAAFNAAIASGRKVFVPAGEYKVSDIAVVNSIDIEGERINNSNTVLIVGTSGSGAFTHSKDEIVYDIRIANLTVKAGPGVLNARVYKQVFKDQYTAYAIFEGIDSWLDLEIAFDGFFIFTRWFDCRDGYNGTKRAEHGHHFINSTPANYGTFNQTNLNQVVSCRIFLSEGHRGAVDIAYGSTWVFRDTDFEKCKTRPLYAAGIFQLHMTDCWIEECVTTSLIQLETSPEPNAQGVRSFEMDNIHFKGIAGNTHLVAGDWAASTAFRHIVCVTVPTGMKLSSASTALDIKCVEVLSGDSGLLTGIKGVLGEHMSAGIGFTNSPATANINVLPIGPTSLGNVNFTRVGFSASDDVASVFKGNAIRFTVIPSHNYAYYQIPSKMVEFLRGKTITLVASGYGDVTSNLEGISVRVWDSVTPNESNHSASRSFLSANAPEVRSGYVSHTVSASASSLHVGIYCGGANSGKNIYLETMALVLGNAQPSFTGL